MTVETIKISFDRDAGVHQAVCILAEDLIAALAPQRHVELDLSGWNGSDILVIQLVEAALSHADLIGSSLTLVRPLHPDVERVLDRAGIPQSAMKSFWKQGDSHQ